MTICLSVQIQLKEDLIHQLRSEGESLQHQQKETLTKVNILVETLLGLFGKFTVYNYS